MKIIPRFLRALALVGLMAFLAAEAGAVEVEATRDDTYQQLSQGDLKSMALTSDGYLYPSYARRQAGNSQNEIVWDALREKSGSILCATGHHGKLVRLVDDKTTRTVGALSEPELTALAPFKNGSVLVAAAPSGRIYKLDANDKLTTWTQLKAKFVWRLVPDQDGSVWAVTGTEGRLFRLSEAAGAAKVEEVARFKSANLLDLWVDREGLLGTRGDVYVAGQNPGWLYRWRPGTGATEVAFNAQAEEIRRLLPTAEGLVLALNTERSPSSQALSMTLRMSGGLNSPPPMGGTGGPGGPAGSPGAPPLGGSSASLPPPDSSLSQAFAPGSQGGFGMPRSEVVVLDKSGFVRGLWQAPDRPIHDLALSPEGRVLASAGSAGRLFEISLKNGEYAVVADIREDYLMRIVADEKGYLLTAARNGVVFDMARRQAAEAEYVSRPIDAGKLVKWGHVYFRGELREGQQALLSFRIGNDGDPDSTFWGEWSKPVEARPQQAIETPAGPARFLQYRLTFRQGDKVQPSPRMDNIDLYFIGRNAAPVIQQVTATESALLSSRGSGSGGSSSSSSSGEGSSASNSSGGSGSPAPAFGQNPGGSRSPRSNTMSLSISWRVNDPNGDTLRYALYFKGEEEKAWKLIDKDLSVTQMPLSVSGLADGHYRFRLVATDELGNPPGEGLSDEEVSNEIVVDNTPPVIENKAVRMEGNQAVLTLDAADNTSLISSVRVDLDNGDDYPLAAADGVMDQQRESFQLKTKPLRPGEHVATVSVTDARGNTTVGKVVFTVEK